MTRLPSNPRFERWRWQIFGVTWLAYAGFYLTRKAFSVAKNELKKPEILGLTTGQMATMDGAYSATYALGQFLWGTLGDRFGPRRITLLGMMASIVTSVLMGFSGTFTALLVLFALQGLWQSSGWAPLAKNMGEFFSRKERGSVLGFWCTNYALGGFVASIIAGYAATRLGWQFAWWCKNKCVKEKAGVSQCLISNETNTKERRYTHENKQCPRHRTCPRFRP